MIYDPTAVPSVKSLLTRFTTKVEDIEDGTLQENERLGMPLEGYFSIPLEGFGRCTPMTLLG
jgi:hypothetical protein